MALPRHPRLPAQIEEFPRVNKPLLRLAGPGYRRPARRNPQPITGGSLPGLTRQSIHLRRNFLAKGMDARVEPAHDGGESLRTRPPGAFASPYECAKMSSAAKPA